jgi:hypothetical protein
MKYHTLLCEKGKTMKFPFRLILHPLKIFLILFWVFMAAFHGSGQEQKFAPPFEKEGGFVSANPIDDLVLAGLRANGIEPANLCSDGVFIRRIYLDVVGALPEPQEVAKFLQDTNPDKRARLIDTLLERPEFADYWALKWCDILRVKAEFPINLWPNAVQAYQRWICDSLRENKPYDWFVREMLTSSGSNFRVPPVNFYRAMQGRDPAALAGVVALTFMGTRIDKWPEERRAGMAAFFSKVRYKKTLEWKEEIVYSDTTSTPTVEAIFPDGEKVKIPPDQDPRQVFADWLIAPNNPWFTRNIVNRVWSWLLGRGIIQEPDDIRPDNPPSNPELLAYLEKEMVKSNYDLKHIYRLILNSSAYQQSPIAKSDKPEADALFAHYQVRRLDAEVLADALNWFGGTGEGYISPIPEPFTFIPDYQRTIDLADGSITSQFLEMFGRPARDTGLESERNNDPSDSQRLYLLNSNEIQKKIAQSARLRRIINDKKKTGREIIRAIYLTLLSRYPTETEADVAEKYIQTPGLNRNNAAQDLAWALINTKEFLYRH